MSAFERHNAMVAAYGSQQAEFAARRPGADIWTGALAARFRDNPRRPFDPILEALAGYLRPGDVLLDVGGGAGRLALPLALRCREVVVVDPSEGMQAQFEATRAEGQIENARYLKADWLDAPAIEGDCALVSHVTYFIPDVETFLRRLVSAASRRVMILVNSTPPPNTARDLFQLVHGVPQALVPGHRELLPVLWEMGFLPEVKVLPTLAGGTQGVWPTREEAIESIVKSPVSIGASEEQLQTLARERFDELFVEHEAGWIRTTAAGVRALLITWETG